MPSYFIGFLFQLRKAIIDHVSDSFLETNVPLMLLIEAAEAGNEKEVEECAVVFREHATKLEEVGFICLFIYHYYLFICLFICFKFPVEIVSLCSLQKTALKLVCQFCYCCEIRPYCVRYTLAVVLCKCY